jgi:hypothetical protein
MTLTYALEDAGWAKAEIEHRGESVKMRVSWLSDVLAELIEAAIDVMEGAESTRFPFPDEPGGHECVIHRSKGGDRVQLRVLWHREWWTPAGQTPAPGEEVFACDCTAGEFSREVFRICKRLLDQYGEEGYKERWCMHEFPTERFEYLSRLLFPPQRLQSR